MLGSKKRDYKTEHVSTTKRIKVFREKYERYIAEGMDKLDAEKKAYDEVKNGK